MKSAVCSSLTVQNKFSLVMPRYLVITIIIIAISNLLHRSASRAVVKIEIAMQCCNPHKRTYIAFERKIVWGFHPRYMRAMQFCTDWILLEIHVNFIIHAMCADCIQCCVHTRFACRREKPPLLILPFVNFIIHIHFVMWFHRTHTVECKLTC